MQSQVKIGKKAKTRAAYWKKFGGGWVVAGLVYYKKNIHDLYMGIRSEENNNFSIKAEERHLIRARRSGEQRSGRVGQPSVHGRGDKWTKITDTDIRLSLCLLRLSDNIGQYLFMPLFPIL